MKHFIRLSLLSLVSLLTSCASHQAGAAQPVGGVVAGTVDNEIFSAAGTNAIDAEVIKAIGLNVIIATNGQRLNRATNYYVPINTTVSIWMTNGGTINVYGNGIISSNWLANGAVANIQCYLYCPNGGQTIFNFH